MDTEEKLKMSSLLEGCDVKETTVEPLSAEITTKESCSSFKTGSNSSQSSATSIEKTTLLGSASDTSDHVIEEKNDSLTYVCDALLEPEEDYELDTEDKLLIPVDLIVDNKHSDTSLILELTPDEEASVTTLNQVCYKIESVDLELEDLVSSLESKNEKNQLNIPMEVDQSNFFNYCQETVMASERRPTGDTLCHGNEDENQRMLGSGEDTREAPNIPEIKAPISSVVTILKPKPLEVMRVKSETLCADKKTPSFFVTNIVSGRLDLGDNAELLDDLIFWRNPKKTAFIFVSVPSVLVSMQYYSLISVMAYVSLALLVCGFVGRVYSTSHGTVHPILQFSPSLTEDSVRKFIDLTAFYVNDTILAMRRLYMADDLADSIKFALVLWYLTYVGLWFNGMTIVTISFVTIFTVPNIYEYHKERIDEKLAVCWNKWLSLTDQARTVSKDSIKRMLTTDRRHEKVN